MAGPAPDVVSDFRALLTATLAVVRDLKTRGVSFVDVRPETLDALSRLHPPTPGPSPHSQPAVEEEERYSSLGNAVVVAEPPSVAPQPAATPPAPPALTATVAPTMPAPDTSSAEEKRLALAAIRERALVCQKCPHLVRTRTQVVFGVGNPAAELMFVGEAPGLEEDRQGEPFVGPAGQLLTKMISTMGFAREEVYIANVLKCRPDMPPGAPGNRPPRPDEMDTCKPYLLSQIDIIQPKVIVALGNTATQGLLGAKSPGALRGKWQSLRGIPVMPTFHPSYLLRAVDNPDQGISEKRKTWEHMLQVLERLGRPITARMRGYFLPRTGSAA